jgi:hypothetical protein
MSVSDAYDDEKIDKALRLLGEDPERDLNCIYCGHPAETWDHVIATVKNGKYSGYGHQIGNLVPCCKDCNSKKGNKDWKTFLNSKRPSEIIEPIVTKRMEDYINLSKSNFESYMDEDIAREILKLDEIKEKVFLLLKEGDHCAGIIRENLRNKISEGRK